MEVTKADIKKLKLSPTLITFLKAVHFKDNDYLEELNKVADILKVSKHLQSIGLIKIVGDGISHKNYSLRTLELVNYFNQETNSALQEAKSIFEHFISTSNSKTGKVSGVKFNTFKKFLIGRVNQGVDFDTAREIINMKFDEWWGTQYQHHLNFRTLLGSTHYPQYVQQLDMREEKTNNEFSDDI